MTFQTLSGWKTSTRPLLDTTQVSVSYITLLHTHDEGTSNREAVNLCLDSYYPKHTLVTHCINDWLYRLSLQFVDFNINIHRNTFALRLS